MKKIGYLLLIGLFLLFGCTDPSNLKQEYHKAITDAFEMLEFPTTVASDIELVTSIEIDEYTVLLSYETSSSALSSEGKVTRGETDVVVIVKCTGKIEDVVITTDIAVITVLGIDSIDYQGLCAKAIGEVVIPSSTVSNINLPTTLTIDGVTINLEWHSSNSSVLNANGEVTRSDADEEVILSVTFTIDNYTETKEVATVVVISQNSPVDYQELCDKAVGEVAIPNSTISNINLPTTLTIDGVTINLEWHSSNSNVINANGEVTRSEVDGEAILSVTFTIGDYTVTKEVAKVTVLKIEDDGEFDIYTSELLLIDYPKRYIELLDCSVTKISEELEVYFENENKQLTVATVDDLMIGLRDIKVYVYQNEVKKIYIPSDFTFTEIRVAIRKDINDIANKSTLYHDSITLTINSQTTIKTYDNTQSYELAPGTITITHSDGKIVVTLSSMVKYEFTKRVIINKTNADIHIGSISRGGSSLYAGAMDISIVEGRLLLINQVDVEEYLRKVVPSEMPSSWSKEALKSQAVAARTYAYCEYYNKNYLELGYVVDDSTQSQVYNNQDSRQTTDVAVSETRGLVMFNGNRPIIAYYYSSSCGLTANGNEVWIKDGVVDPIPYLIGKNLSTTSTGDEIEVDPTSEAKMLEYFKLIRFVNPGGNASYHRWRIAYTKEQLRNTINANILNMSTSYPESFLQLEDGNWVMKDFPTDIGNIQDIFVSERGESGVVVSIQIVTDKLTFRIYNQYNIRFTIRGRDAGSTVTLYYGNSNSNLTSTSRNPSILNSGFFALEWNDDVLTFYGGGNGHGVGMDQYGANYYAQNGKTFEEILNTYYSNIEFVQTIK